MKHAARIALLAVLLATLPLRGYAGALMALCEGQHGGTAASHAHEHGDGQHDNSPSKDSGNPSHAASVCSVCASCCASAGLAPAAPHLAVVQHPDSRRIAFFDRRSSGFVPEHLDRPPLAS